MKALAYVIVVTVALVGIAGSIFALVQTFLTQPWVIAGALCTFGAFTWAMIEITR
jgi:hypothetical protein